MSFVTVTTEGTFSFLNFASFVRPPSNASAIEVITVTELTSESTPSTSTYVITFPQRFSSVTYDPNFSVSGNSGGIRFVLCCVVLCCVVLCCYADLKSFYIGKASGTVGQSVHIPGVIMALVLCVLLLLQF